MIGKNYFSTKELNLKKKKVQGATVQSYIQIYKIAMFVIFDTVTFPRKLHSFRLFQADI